MQRRPVRGEIETAVATTRLRAGEGPELRVSLFIGCFDDTLFPQTGRAVVMTACTCAIAQTCTLVLDHGPGQGRRALTLFPDDHLCVVPASAIVGLVPEAVARVAGSVRAGRPRTLDVLILDDA